MFKLEHKVDRTLKNGLDPLVSHYPMGENAGLTIFGCKTRQFYEWYQNNKDFLELDDNESRFVRKRMKLYAEGYSNEDIASQLLVTTCSKVIATTLLTRHQEFKKQSLENMLGLLEDRFQDQGIREFVYETDLQLEYFKEEFPTQGEIDIMYPITSKRPESKKRKTKPKKAVYDFKDGTLVIESVLNSPISYRKNGAINGVVARAEVSLGEESVIVLPEENSAKTMTLKDFYLDVKSHEIILECCETGSDKNYFTSVKLAAPKQKFRPSRASVEGEVHDVAMEKLIAEKRLEALPKSAYSLRSVYSEKDGSKVDVGRFILQEGKGDFGKACIKNVGIRIYYPEYDAWGSIIR